MDEKYNESSVQWFACSLDINEFPDDSKQEILELKLFNIFFKCIFKWIIFVVEVLESTNKIFQIYFFDNSVFRLVATLKFINEISEKHSKKSVFKVGSSRPINKILEKYLWRNLHSWKLLRNYLWNTAVKE